MTQLHRQGADFFTSVARGSAAGVALNLFHYGTRFALTPLVLAAVGFEAYGYWALLFQFLGLVGLHRIGLPTAVVPLVARSWSAGDLGRLERQVQTSAVVTGALAALVVAFGVALAPSLVALLGVDEAGRAEAAWTLRVTAVVTGVALTLGGYQSVLEGLQRYPTVRWIEGLACTVEAALIVLLLRLDVGLSGLAYAYGVRVLLPLPVFAWIARRAIPGLVALPLRAERELLRPILTFGGSLQLLGFLHLFVATVDRLVLAHGVSLFAAGTFELARKLIVLGTSLPLQACAPLTSAFAGRGPDAANPAPLARTALRLLTILSLPLLGLFFFAPGALLGLWLGEAPGSAVTALRLLAVGAYVHLATGPLTSLLRSQATGRLELLYMLRWAILATLLVPAGCWAGGLPGAAAGSALSQAAGALWLLSKARSFAGLNPRELAHDLARPLLCAVPAGIWVASTLPAEVGRMESLVALGSRAPVFVAVTWSLVWFLALRADERRAIVRLVRPRAAQLRRALPFPTR
ncbi:MAG: MATE family efflux transporter [Planctomycetota bacterium]